MADCFLCLNDIDGDDDRPTMTVGLGFVVHQDCYESGDDD